MTVNLLHLSVTIDTALQATGGWEKLEPGRTRDVVEQCALRLDVCRRYLHRELVIERLASAEEAMRRQLHELGEARR